MDYKKWIKKDKNGLKFIWIRIDFAINIPQWLICHKTKPNQTKPNHIYLMYV